jgi:two-component system response regulator FixJ
MSKSGIVYIVDDDEALRDSLQVLFRAHGIASCEFANGNSFLREFSSISGGCALIDINMPGMSGIELLSALKGSERSIPCIMMTGLGDVATAVLAMKLGAVDFIEKPFELDALIEIVLRALDGAQNAGGFSSINPDAVSAIAALTPRERDVMAGIAKGNPNKIIAHELGISPRTVEVHRARVMEKLGAQSVADVVKLAISGGMLT